jgi:flavin-dependent dehydrogenase
MPNRQRLTADVLVVGAGAAGIAAARVLNDRGVKVTHPRSAKPHRRTCLDRASNERALTGDLRDPGLEQSARRRTFLVRCNDLELNLAGADANESTLD